MNGSKSAEKNRVKVTWQSILSLADKDRLTL